MKKSEQDRVAQSERFRNARDRDHKLAVQRLQQWTWNRWLDDDDPDKRKDTDADTELFAAREVADAMGASIKVIRSLARHRLLKATKKAGRVFFSAGTVIKYLRGCAILSLPASHHRACFRSEKVATDSDFVSGLLTPKAEAAAHAKLSIRSIERAIKSGKLKARKIGKMTLVECESSGAFCFKRDCEAVGRLEAAQKRLEAAHKDYCRITSWT